MAKKKVKKKVKAKRASAPKKATTRRKAPVSDDVMVNFKASRLDKKKIQVNANKFAEGNLSAWVRFAALRHAPKRSERLAK